jgi:hypothetical protein
MAIWRAPNRVALRGTVIVFTSSGSMGELSRGRQPGVSDVIGEPDKSSRRIFG